MRPLLSIAGIIILLDQATKYLVLKFMPIYTGEVIVPGFFNLVHVRNTGAAFSMLAGENTALRQTVMISLTLAVVAMILYTYFKVRVEDRWTRTGYILITGGALGNVIDRFRFGEVVDFLDFYVGSYHWPAFNVADSAISVGAVMLIISLFKGR
ncbi:MAG: signal peptidase II [Desulfobacteraceae bacterium]|nr:signal peptidase II [Desulfobacteraceae bacterium]